MDLLYKLTKKKYSVEEAIKKLESEKYLNSNSFSGKIVRAAITISPDDYYLRATTETNIEIGKIMPFNQLFGKDIEKKYNEFCSHLFKIRKINDFSLIEYLKTHNAYNESDIKLIIVHLNNFTYIKYLSELRQHFKDILDLLKLENESSNTSNKKSKPELVNQSITFDKPETIIKLHNELKGCFPKNEDELLKVLQGEQLTEFLLFPDNQNKFVEVFKRVKYNGFIFSNLSQINKWICLNFTYCYEKGDIREVRNFNPNTIKTIFTNHKKEKYAEPTPIERICTPDWLPHFWYKVRKKQ